MAAKKTHVMAIVHVRGRGTFPLDMLRYDACAPLESEDASSIGDLRHGRGEAERVVKLAMFTSERRDPTHARWRSFGWLVVEVNGQKVI